MTAPAALLSWCELGEKRLSAVIRQLPDDGGDPTLLPGWDRAHLLAHLAGNADALINLLRWARTGVETPMYPSPEARDTQIAAAATLPPDELRHHAAAAAVRLGDAMRQLPDAAWSASVRTAQGRTVPAREVPWMRCREVWVHAVDLAADVGFGDMPGEVLAALAGDVFASWARRNQVPDVTVRAGGGAWGSGRVTVAGPLPAVTAWLTGRSAGTGLQASGPLPALPRWL
jgi:maleylpyruvate isomerase